MSTPDPVLDLAKLDVRSTQKAHAGLLLATVGGPLVVAGGAGVTFYARRDTKFGAGLSWSMLGGGTLGVLVGPPLLAVHGLRSRRALAQQGLQVSPIPAYTTWGLYAGSFIVGWASINSGSVPLGIVAISMYAGSAASGAAQLRMNHVARRRAGWLTRLHWTPWTTGDALGIALVTSG